MSSPISPIRTVTNLPAVAPTTGNPTQSTDFQSLFEGAINRVDGMKAAANQGVEQFLAGEGDDLHTTILATQRAELAFDLFLQVRNKVVSAYQEIMKMQV